MILKKHERRVARAAKQARAAANSKDAQIARLTAENARMREMVTDLLHGVCPCHGDLEDPGPDHAAWCKWSDPAYDGSGVCCGEVRS